MSFLRKIKINPDLKTAFTGIFLLIISTPLIFLWSNTQKGFLPIGFFGGVPVIILLSIAITGLTAVIIGIIRKIKKSEVLFRKI